MADLKTIGTLFLGCVVVLYIGRRVLCSQSSYPLPPGPPGIPWVGNVIGINARTPWKTYAEWAKIYGDIVYTQLLGKDIIIINSEKIAKDLLEKRSRNYSDRPYIITSELTGIDFSSGSLPYGNKWRLHRRFYQQTYRLETASRFLPLLHRKSTQLLRQLFGSPYQFDDHLFEYAASVMLNSTYDYDPSSRNDEIVDIAAKVLTIVVPAVRPDISVILGTFPFLLHLPSWLPGMGFKKRMATARAYAKEYLERPLEYSLRKATSGKSGPSMLHDELHHLLDKGISPEESWMEALKGALGTAFLAASESTCSVLATFFLMMMLNPDAQEKSQSQIDAMVGKDRLPVINDRSLLPFVDAIFWETLRYNPVLPLLFPHSAVEDDVYNGFHIPKGAMLMANVWSMAHNESKYPNPHTFFPERFLADDGTLKSNDIEHITFGFGRRICPGRHFADMSLWIVIARVLAMFKILKPLDENGVEIPMEPRFSNGLAVHPLPFKCRIVPRMSGMDARRLEELIAVSTP